MANLREAARSGQAALAICRGTLRLASDLGYSGIPEVPLANGRRADLVCLGRGGDVWIIEIKSSVADFRSDEKWPEYRDYCDRFSFAVPPDFPRDLIPSHTGLIVADAFSGAVIREAGETRLSPARRKAMTLRLARIACARLSRMEDADWTGAPELPYPTLP